MKALTICQPYAHLICLPDDDDRAKRVENRTWSTDYRGPLLIHAGKSRKFLSGDNYGIPMESMDFGSVIGVCQLSECFKFDDEPSWQSEGIPENVLRRFKWLGCHKHVEGPFCFVLTRVRRFEKPIPYRGAQGFFEVPKEIVADSLAQLEPVA
jgi:hypothetical protein